MNPIPFLSLESILQWTCRKKSDSRKNQKRKEQDQWLKLRQPVISDELPPTLYDLRFSLWLESVTDYLSQLTEIVIQSCTRFLSLDSFSILRIPDLTSSENSSTLASKRRVSVLPYRARGSQLHKSPLAEFQPPNLCKRFSGIEDGRNSGSSASDISVPRTQIWQTILAKQGIFGGSTVCNTESHMPPLKCLLNMEASVHVGFITQEICMRFTSSRAEHALRVHLKNDDAAITRLAGQASRSKNPKAKKTANSQRLPNLMIGWSGTFESWHTANLHALNSGVSVGRRNLCCLIRPGERVAERRGCLVPKIRDPCNLAAASAVAGTHCMPYGLYPVTKAMLSSGRWQLFSPTPLQRHNPNEFNGVLRIDSPSVGVSHAGARISLTLENPEILSYTRSPTPH
ncbi:uncharacterized protein CLUP02_11684 [Colletotrichum lupini]|uniref:Uncharacterized protein n=1 Tax=Colletotrichum lupini TaxID=145971 RepID=A0A9Q8WK01_9PEZI|nr:uncharacterized protein CLUP02_11684 [Colletotrichum lupini]UQC86184.1 hypothetical protein CLUP02_11684 [Colletotrichum lupini]